MYAAPAAHRAAAFVDHGMLLARSASDHWYLLGRMLFCVQQRCAASFAGGLTGLHACSAATQRCRLLTPDSQPQSCICRWFFFYNEGALAAGFCLQSVLCKVLLTECPLPAQAHSMHSLMVHSVENSITAAQMRKAAKRLLHVTICAVLQHLVILSDVLPNMTWQNMVTRVRRCRLAESRCAVH